MKKTLLLCLVLSALSPAAYADEDTVDNDNTDKKQIYHLSGDVNLVPTVKVEYGKPRIVIKEVYPVIESETQDDNIDNFNQLIDSMLKEDIARFTQEVKDNQSAQATLEKSAIKNDLTIDFDTSIVNTGKNPIISIRFTMQTYIAGMAHPAHYHRVLNYDLYNGHQLTLTDLFQPNSDYLTILSDYTKNVLSKRLKDKEMIAVGTAPKEENFKNWNINPHGLLITFDEAKVAPYVYGTQSVLVPYSILKSVMLPKSAISNCLLHRKRCLQNNLLTGGFIDEAANTPRANSQHRVLNPVLRQS